MPEIISEDQNGFIKGRHSGIVIRAVDDIIEFTDKLNIPGALVSLDYTKAFDSLSKEFLLKSFELFGFGPELSQWIRVINSEVISAISYNGWLSNWFPIECGIRQGCPLSPFCFIIACEILACKIRQNNNIKGIQVSAREEIKILQYADDTTLFLGDECSIDESLRIIDLFSEISFLNLNRNKTEAMWVGCWKYRRKTYSDITWKLFPDNRINLLGVIFQNDRSASDIADNWESRIEKCEGIMKSWMGRNVSIYGKIVLTKSLLMSQFLYIMVPT